MTRQEKLIAYQQNKGVREQHVAASTCTYVGAIDLIRLDCGGCKYGDCGIYPDDDDKGTCRLNNNLTPITANDFCAEGFDPSQWNLDTAEDKIKNFKQENQ